MSVTDLRAREILERPPSLLETLEGKQLLGHIITSGGVEIGLGCNGIDATEGGRLLSTILDRLGTLSSLVSIEVGQHDNDPDSLVVSIRQDSSNDSLLF